MTTPITTIPELEALPVGSVILDSDGVAWQRLEANWWKSTDGTGTGGVQGIFSPPWTLLHVPGESQDPSPTVLALAQALATRDGLGRVFTSTTRSETSAEIASYYVRQAREIVGHLPPVSVEPSTESGSGPTGLAFKI